MAGNRTRTLTVRAILPAALLLLLLAAPARAANILEVPSADYPTIGHALFFAEDGDTINVAPGTYRESLNWAGKQLVIQGAGPGETIIDPHPTGGGPGGPCLQVENLPAGSVVRGFTLANGRGGGDSTGGGILVTGSNLAVEDCAFVDNFAFHGGALHVDGSSEVSISGSTFSGNEASTGGALMLTSVEGGAFNVTITDTAFTGNTAAPHGGAVAVIGPGTLTVAGCEFTANTANIGGGGLYREFGAEITITGSAFTDNAADHGGGIYLDKVAPGPSGVTITNTTFTGNTTGGLFARSLGPAFPVTLVNSLFSGNTGYGAALGNVVATVTNCTFAGNRDPDGIGLWSAATAQVEVRNSILWGNLEQLRLTTGGTVDVIHSNVEGGLPADASDGGDNIDADPLFVRDPGTLDEADPGDLRLQEDSPSIDAGNDAFVTVPPFPTDEADNPVDLDGNPRSAGDAVDMGAYEFQPAGDPPPPGPTPEEMIQQLADDVAALVAAGVPLPANGQPLFAKLSAALGHLTAGEVDEAIGALGAFSNQVNAFVRSRRLTPAQAEPLLDAAEAIIAELSAG